jgi:hypothetical protein
MAVTVRFPGARTAPVRRTLTGCHTGRENTGAKPPWHCARRSARRAWPSVQDEENMSCTADRF